MANRTDPVGDTGAVVAHADELLASGRVHEAIGLLTARNHQAPDRRLEELLVRVRHDGYGRLALGPVPARPPIAADPDAPPEIPEHSLADLDAAGLQRAFAQHGCAIVRGVVSPARAAELAGDVDRALAAFDAGMSGVPATETSPWFARFTPGSSPHRLGSRQFMRASGGMWAVDSPRMLFTLCELLDQTGVGALVTDFLGERPALSALKCNLRRVPTDTNSDWHQDGAFLGTEVRSVNLWLALSDCGVDAPGLDLVPRRLDDLVETGTDGALFDWSVSPDVVDTVTSRPVVRPAFAAGDALLFDHLLLHRTGVDPTMTKERYAIECWMFAPSRYPADQIPLVY